MFSVRSRGREPESELYATIEDHPADTGKRHPGNHAGRTCRVALTVSHNFRCTEVIESIKEELRRKKGCA